MAQLPASIAQAAYEEARRYARQALSPATTRAYRADWTHFVDWCASAGLSALPAEPSTVAAYLAGLARTHARSTIERRLVAIGKAHRTSGHDWRPAHPEIRATLAGMFRSHGRPRVKSAAIMVDDLARLLAACPETLAGLRDRALFLTGFAGALRRSELVSLQRSDVSFHPKRGATLFLSRSKTDQSGEGAVLGIAYGSNPATCPVRTLRRWIDASGCERGPIFRAIRRDGTIRDRPLAPGSVSDILRIRAATAGLEPGITERLSAHGFRAGFITEAYARGLRDEEIMPHTRHTDYRTMRGYVRRAKLASDSPSSKVGL